MASMLYDCVYAVQDKSSAERAVKASNDFRVKRREGHRSLLQYNCWTATLLCTLNCAISGYIVL